MVVMVPNKESNYISNFEKNGNQFNIENSNENDGDDEVTQEIKVIAQEVKIVKSLACNDLAKRNRQMKKLYKWLQLRAKSSFAFTQEDFVRIWKGLYYNMWYSDKPLVQEELAEQLGKLLGSFEGNLKYGVDFFGAFLKTMCIEWFGIDQWRIDKFLMLARRMLRYTFKLLKESEWNLEAIEIFNKHATDTVLFENCAAKGLTMHYFDIFLEELAKVSEGNIAAEQVGMFVKPFVKFMGTQTDFSLLSHCRTRIFYHLLYQSNLGREYTEKYNAWKDMGFPTKHINDLEKMEESESGGVIESAEQCEDQKYLDPRAGNVDVFMPELPLEAQSIIKEIEYFLNKKECVTKRRKLLRRLLNLFKTYENGEFPLGIKTMPRFEGKSEKPLVKEKIEQLNNLENELFGVDRKLKQMTKRKRRKFLKYLNFDEIDENNYEKTLEEVLPKDYLIERKKRSQKSVMTGWVEEDLKEEDLRPKKTKRKNRISHEKNTKPKIEPKKNKLKVPTSESNESLEPVKKLRKVEKSLQKTSNEKFVKANVNQKNNEDLIEDKSTLIICEKIPNENNCTPEQAKILKISDREEICFSKPILSTLKESNVLKTSDFGKQPHLKKSEWDEPLAEGEVEYFIPSRKLQLKTKTDLVLNPLVKHRLSDNQSSHINYKSSLSTPRTPGSTKRVKIALKHNTSQNAHEYIQQIKSSPNIPYDAKKKPGKGLLKPNTTPSPINPFYKKKIGLKFLNDTI